MEVKPGHKQSDVGVIPEDWEVRRIGAVCKLINGRGFKPFEWQRTGLPIIRIQNLNGSDDFNYYSGTYDRKLEVQLGQLLFAWSGSRGTSFGPYVWKGPFGLLNYHTWKVQIHEFEIGKDFLFHALKQLTGYIEGWAHGASALVHVQKWQMEGFQLALPPAKAEQEAISKALSDADALIECLEQLISKKRHLKQGAIQELLTGKKRLPGFEKKKGFKQTEVGVIPEDWEVVPVSQRLRGAPTYGINASAIPFDSRFPTYLRITDITKDGRFAEATKASVAHPSAMSYLLEPGDIVFARTGASVGKSYLYNPRDGDLVFAGFLIRLRPDCERLLPEYLWFYSQSNSYWNWVTMNCMRSGQPGINGEQYASLPLPLPPTKAEQETIAAILSDMDAEIAALEEKLAKTRQIKQGMMQELLTGRIRLL
ncbi:MAG: restriction endonuclease subunit S [Methylocella sp.]